MAKSNFTSLFVPKKHRKQSATDTYRVYSSKNEFVEVEANSALEALSKSGLEHAYRIERPILVQSNILSNDDLATEEGVTPDGYAGVVGSSSVMSLDEAMESMRPLEDQIPSSTEGSSASHDNAAGQETPAPHADAPPENAGQAEQT